MDFALALLTVAVALTATTDVTGTPTAGFLDAKAPQSGLSFGGGGGGMGFGQQLGAAADRFAQRVSDTFTAPFKKPSATEETAAAPVDDEKKPVLEDKIKPVVEDEKKPVVEDEKKPVVDDEQKPENIDKRIIVPGFDAVTSGPEVKPQPAHDDKATPPGNKLETTTESRAFIEGAPKCGPNQIVDEGTRKCLDSQAAPEE